MSNCASLSARGRVSAASTAGSRKNFPNPNLTGIDPQSGEVVRLFHPRRDGWFDHFGHEEQYVVGTTSVGRTTVSLLEMNDPERRRIRELIGQIQN
jgi:hypothetical protein